MRHALITAALLLPATAFAADAGMTGPATWTRNASESTLAAGMAAPKSQVLKITRDDGKNLAWSMTTVGADGKKHVASWTGAYDGKDRPVKGGGTAALSKDADGTTNVVLKDKDGSVATEKCTFSSDAKKMTCKGSVKLKDGKTADYVDVMDRTK